MEKNKKNIKLSIIVPVYKVKEYIHRCLRSIEAQNCCKNNIEVILVDDGSPDECGEICDKYAHESEYIKVVHKKNGGLSDARNTGLSVANGEYCIFLDSDDELVSDVCEKIIGILTDIKVDVLYLQINWIKNGIINIYEKKGFSVGSIYSGKDALALELKNGKYVAIAPIGIYKRNFLLKNTLLFKKGILHEDEQWSPRVMLKAHNVMRVEIPFYNYYIRENSITQSTNTKRYFDLLESIQELYHLYSKSEDRRITRYGNQYLAKLYMNAVAHILVAGEVIKIQILFLIRNLHGFRNKAKLLLFLISPKKYLKIMEG